MGLESTIASLRAELDSFVPVSARRNHDPSSWLPGPLSHHTLQSHRHPITSVAFHPVFSVLASSSEDCTIKIWDWESGELEKTVRGHTRAVMDVDFGGPKDRVLLASCSTDLTVKLWDPGNAYANVWTLLGHDHSVSAVRFLSPTGNLLASASRDASVRIWDVSTGHCVKVIRAHSDWVRTISPSIDGQWLVSGGNDRTAVICSSVSGEVEAVLTGHENHIECCAFAPPASYEYLAILARQKKLIHTASSAEYVATGSRDKTIKIWDAQGTLVKTLVGHDNWIRGLVFHPSGKYLLSVADDKTLRCWDLAQEGRVVRTLEGIHDRFVTCVRWAPDVVNDAGKGGNASSVKIRCVLATGSVDSNVQVFVP